VPLDMAVPGHGFRDGDDCQCYVNTTVVNTVKDVPQFCWLGCKTQFLQGLSAAWSNGASIWKPVDDTVWQDICGILSAQAPLLWNVYWCDMNQCGTWINQTGLIWQDRE